uniref:DUF4408 domain-containing protein n=1 Tax=Oryza punctata TaxID=4537 RepID=A0A0E0KG16_ORYPU
MEYISLSSTLSAQLHAVGSFVMSKKALFVFSNAIFLLLTLLLQLVDTVVSKTSKNNIDYCHDGRRDGEGSRRNVRTPDDEIPSREQKAHGDIAMPSPPEFCRLDEETKNVILESVVIEEPTCGTVAQELDKLGINELNKKFEEFIKSRRTKWEKEEVSLNL